MVARCRVRRPETLGCLLPAVPPRERPLWKGASMTLLLRVLLGLTRPRTRLRKLPYSQNADQRRVALALPESSRGRIAEREAGRSRELQSGARGPRVSVEKGREIAVETSPRDAGTSGGAAPGGQS